MKGSLNDIETPKKVAELELQLNIVNQKLVELYGNGELFKIW